MPDERMPNSIDSLMLWAKSNKWNTKMLFTWSTNNLCIVFSWWRVTGPLSLLFSLIAVAALTAGYEGVRQVTNNYEQAHKARLSAFGERTSSE